VRSKILDTRLARDVSFADLRHDDRPVHRAEGYGGQPIEAFPPYSFYLLREMGKTEEAEERYHAWYREQFDRYRYMEKPVGGMKNGSLYRLVVQLHHRQQVPLSGSRLAFREDLIDQAIRLRVEERFGLLSSIKDKGYERSPADPVVGVARAHHVYLSSGHHRAAALRAIQRSVVPGVLVLSPTARYFFRRLRIA
jgi:predicted DNA-binding transcriptional regulator AlpA